MKLEKILDSLNSLEKNSFIKIIDQILSSDPRHSKEIDKLLSNSDKELKSADSVVVSKIFNLVEDEFSKIILEEFQFWAQFMKTQYLFPQVDAAQVFLLSCQKEHFRFHHMS